MTKKEESIIDQVTHIDNNEDLVPDLVLFFILMWIVKERLSNCTLVQYLFKHEEHENLLPHVNSKKSN